MIKIKIQWIDFIEVALNAYPEEACGFLFSDAPYGILKENWVVFPVKNISPTPLQAWKPDQAELRIVKQRAREMELTLLGNIHTHPFDKNRSVDELLLPSDIDLSYAKRYNDTIRGIMVVDNETVYGIRFHDKFGQEISILCDIIKGV